MPYRCIITPKVSPLSIVWLSEEINATGSGGGADGAKLSVALGAEALEATLTVKRTRHRASTEAKIRRIRSIDLSIV